MQMTMLFNLSYVSCFVALVMAVVGGLSGKRFYERVNVALLGFGTLCLSGYILLRWMHAGRAPFSNMYESLVLFAWAVAVIYLALRLRITLAGLGAAAALMAGVTLACASAFFDDEVRPLVPALQSNWLTFHVFTCFLGYGGFAVSFLASIWYLGYTADGRETRQETRETLEDVVVKTVSFGFLFLTAGIITGAVWANSAWGTYWSWDPKETWSLITWIAYATFLHFRYMKGMGGRAMAWLSIAGFACVLFTYFGVNYLLAGLHSYA